MSADGRAALVDRLRRITARTDTPFPGEVADLLEADGKLLALADTAPHTEACRRDFQRSNFLSKKCICWKADFDAAKAATS